MFPIQSKSAQVRAEISRQVKEMLAEDKIISAAPYSEFSSPVVLIQKPDNSFRFCVDYRAVNKISADISSPIPYIEDSIAAIGEKKSRIFFNTRLKVRLFSNEFIS